MRPKKNARERIWNHPTALRDKSHSDCLFLKLENHFEGNQGSGSRRTPKHNWASRGHQISNHFNQSEIFTQDQIFLCHIQLKWKGGNISSIWKFFDGLLQAGCMHSPKISLKNQVFSMCGIFTISIPLLFFSGRAQYVWAETAGKVIGCWTWTRRRWSRRRPRLWAAIIKKSANIKKNERQHFAWRPFSTSPLAQHSSVRTEAEQKVIERCCWKYCRARNDRQT